MKSEVKKAIESERQYQERKFPGHQHTTGEWLLIMQKCVADAATAWNCGHGEGVLDEIRQVTAVGVAAMEQHGAPTRDVPMAMKQAKSRQKMREALHAALDVPAKK